MTRIDLDFDDPRVEGGIQGAADRAEYLWTHRQVTNVLITPYHVALLGVLQFDLPATLAVVRAALAFDEAVQDGGHSINRYERDERYDDLLFALAPFRDEADDAL